MKTTLTTVSVIRGILAIILFLMVLTLIGSLFATPPTANAPVSRSFSVIRIDGSIVGARSFGDAGYDHRATINYIRDLMDNPHDRGILLYMNTPGGTVYHSDELYLTLLRYKEETGRPVHVYMSEVCASGGYFIAMAADHIMANRITMTGSLGVISTMLDTSELFDTIGIRTIVVDSGEHKATGVMGTEVTPQQRAVMQAMIDEYYDLFVELISTGRNMDESIVRGLADGRIYTARQALDLGLIDKIGNWSEALSDFERLTGAPAFYPNLTADASFMGQLFAQAANFFSRNEREIGLSGIDALPRGVPLAIAPELMN